MFQILNLGKCCFTNSAIASFKMAELVKQHFPNSKFETLKDLNGKIV